MAEALPSFPGCQVLRRLRSGPIADVYLALQEPLGRTVEIKALSPSLLPTSPMAARLEHEARALADCDHPSLTRLYDFVRQGDSMWLVLEHVEGVTLRTLLEHAPRASEAEPGRLSALEAAAIALEVARALSHAHRRGVLHRDLRPSHVLLTAEGALKLTEFAGDSDEYLPAALDSEADNAWHVAYQAPEQVLGEAPDPRSDQFALGVILFELLVGRRPFQGADTKTITQNIRHQAPPQLSRLLPGIPTPLERIVQRLLEKLAADRFASMDELTAALEEFLGGNSTTGWIRRALGRASLLGVEEESPLERRAPPRGAPSLSRALTGLAAMGVLTLLGGVVIQVGSEGGAFSGRSSAGSRGLELRPAEPGFLRVVADPWAHVVIDGERVETTPFAEPIPLSPGTHYVRLEHPQAPTERRTITLSPGESVLLDVKLAVPRPAAPAASTVSNEEESP
ncbi:MAG: serine/threonine protein kinase [Polyangiaceae bacterium]|nr:serine/threonine protein kinase [Polyangiaceae bacterium]MCW5792271.1 serine/threonine protein kinase [Polyangiaceae bacterium]